MTTVFRWDFIRVLLVLAALSVALPVALISCGGDEQSPPPAPTTSTEPTRAATAALAPSSLPATEVPTRAEAVEQGDRTLTVYSGRSESLVDPLLETFGQSTGIDIRVKYAGSASTAATLLEEGDNTPADVVFLQDPGSLGSLAAEGMLGELPQETLDQVDPRLRDPNGRWVGTSGRARTVIYNTETINPDADLPSSILDFTEEEWRGRVGVGTRERVLPVLRHCPEAPTGRRYCASVVGGHEGQ